MAINHRGWLDQEADRGMTDDLLIVVLEEARPGTTETVLNNTPASLTAPVLVAAALSRAIGRRTS